MRILIAGRKGRVQKQPLKVHTWIQIRGKTESNISRNKIQAAQEKWLWCNKEQQETEEMHIQRDTQGNQGEVETPGEPDTAEEIKDTGSKAQSKDSKK